MSNYLNSESLNVREASTFIVARYYFSYTSCIRLWHSCSIYSQWPDHLHSLHHHRSSHSLRLPGTAGISVHEAHPHSSEAGPEETQHQTNTNLQHVGALCRYSRAVRFNSRCCIFYYRDLGLQRGSLLCHHFSDHSRVW